MENLILASASPRRFELLRQLGLSFDVVVSGVDEEEVAERDPEKLAKKLALSKAQAVVRTIQDRNVIVIAADTVVCADDVLLGKPVDEPDAKRMLRFLSGRSHQVMTGVAVIRSSDMKTMCHVETTRVFMRNLSEHEINWYVKSGEPFDKAGGYGIQGKAAVFVEKIEGCYFNVVGLPLAALWQLLSNMGEV